ncbi:MAG TPA: hypothetical protein VOA41_09835 [Candidatus Dormibacteraeota bacterium]|nr:hypothetical protein [Candidatus Dormibacteraeota bacterium]
MIVECQNRNRILRDAEPLELAALETHASTCVACARELTAWSAISAAAREMQKSWESPALWPRIEKALAQQMNESRHFARRWRLRFFAGPWQMAIAVAFLAVLTTSVAWLVLHRGETPIQQDSRLLTDSALHEVERTEAAYMKAIGKLAGQARPRLENPASPLVASYREKLVVIDAAITELRANIEQNHSNTHLRLELAAMYREKKETLEAVVREE